jgi:hypothetical protein
MPSAPSLSSRHACQFLMTPPNPAAPENTHLTPRPPTNVTMKRDATSNPPHNNHQSSPREEKLRAQQEDHEARVRRALARAAAPVFKKSGKPQMVRSALPKRRAAADRGPEDADEEELAAFLARELL